MAYDKNKIFKQAEKAIQENNLFFVEDIVAFLPCDKTTFYKFFPVESNELNTLKDMLDDNKVKTKSGIRAKLWKSEKAAELLALYRLIATPEEHQKLNQAYIDHTTNGESMNTVITTLSPDELKERLKK